MPHLVKIGNSQGIRIPKPFIEQARLEGHELKLKLVNEGLLVSPINKSRDNWEESINTIITAQGTEEIDNEWLDSSLTSDEEAEW
jgi:antitoxin MazE